MSATKNECNQGSPSIYRPEANAWISKRSSDLDYKGVFALIKIGFLQSSFYEVMWSSLEDDRFLTFDEVFVENWKNSRDFCKDIRISVKMNDY